MRRNDRRGRCSLRVARALLAACLAMVASGAALADDEIELRLRLSWGGGEARQWRGAISIDEGEIVDWTPLGLEPDSPGSQYLAKGALLIEQRNRQSYDACEIVVRADP